MVFSAYRASGKWIESALTLVIEDDPDIAGLIGHHLNRPATGRG
jgi:hypothetical protein